ncbi:MAG: lipoyl(octanoyl) transferase LipB [Deltaproteobacteria bacterium]|nr:lipoyl(octanoyl) transferase LipB [Deltaproteobacteria bacterium]
MSDPAPVLRLRKLGTVPYRDAFDLQKQLRDQRQDDVIPDTLLLLEHPAVITITRRWGRTNVLATDALLAARGIDLVEVDRGGDVTVHAPGQLVAYPIVKLEGEERDLPRYVRALEQAVLDVMAGLGLAGQRIPGESGVFLDPPAPGGRMEKICAVGVKGTRFVTSHGLAFNVTTDLSVFSLVVPCGLQHRGVTSLQARLGARTPPMDAVMDTLAPALARALGRRLEAAAGP